VTSSYYDVVVLGTDVAPLTCAALLAKRGFRVVVLGQLREGSDYSLGRYRLPRQAFTFTANHAPTARRVLHELGLGQTFRRLTHALDPEFQIALPGHRFDVHGDEAAFDREVEREFPDVRRPVIDFCRRIGQHARSTDRLFERDLAWPPESLLERRELAQMAASFELDREDKRERMLSELPDLHPFRSAMLAPLAFTAQADPDTITTLQLARLLDGHLRDAVSIDGGLAALTNLLIEKIRSHSGHLRMRERASQIIVGRTGATGIRLAGSDEELGCAHVIAGVDVAKVTRLLADRSPFEQMFERLGEPQPRFYRFTLNAIIETVGVPEGMRRDVYSIRDSRRPLHSENLIHVELSRLDERESLLCIEALLPARAVEDRDGSLDGARERLLDALGDLLPFLEQHLLGLDSPHDGRKPWFRDPSVNQALDPLERRGPETMRIVHAFPMATALSTCAMPVRTRLRGLLICNEQVAPALGLEGQLIAAASAARLVTRADRGREWLRRRLWAKVEF